MIWRNGFSYVLRHAWLWPLVFWLRPFAVLARLVSNRTVWMEFACAVGGGAIWGSMAGSLLWLWTGEMHAIWGLGFAVTVAVALAFAGAAAGPFAGDPAGDAAFAGAG